MRSLSNCRVLERLGAQAGQQPRSTNFCIPRLRLSSMQFGFEYFVFGRHCWRAGLSAGPRARIEFWLRHSVHFGWLTQRKSIELRGRWACSALRFLVLLEQDWDGRLPETSSPAIIRTVVARCLLRKPSQVIAWPE